MTDKVFGIDNEECDYIWRNYYNLLPSQSGLLLKAMQMSGNNDSSRKMLLRSVERDNPDLYKKYVNSDRVCENKETFMMTMAMIALDSNRESIHFERCGKCGGLAQTPIAEQCLNCGHEWRGENPRRKKWESEQ